MVRCESVSLVYDVFPTLLKPLQLLKSFVVVCSFVSSCCLCYLFPEGQLLCEVLVFMVSCFLLISSQVSSETYDCLIAGSLALRLCVEAVVIVSINAAMVLGCLLAMASLYLYVWVWSEFSYMWQFPPLCLMCAASWHRRIAMIR